MDTDADPGEHAGRAPARSDDRRAGCILDDDVYGVAVDLMAQSAMQGSRRFVPPRREYCGWNEEGLLVMRNEEDLLAIFEGNDAHSLVFFLVR